MFSLLAILHLFFIVKTGSTFLDIESLDTVNMFPRVDEGARSVMTPSSMHFGNMTFNKIYVNIGGFFTFGKNYTGSHPYQPLFFPLVDNYVVAPFWDDVDLRFKGGSYYILLTRNDTSNIVDDVNTFISDHQSIPFNADWILVAKWINVCWYNNNCADHETNTFQALIASQDSLSYAVFTYKCDLLRWTFRSASIGYSGGPYFFANHPLSMQPNVTDIDCINEPNSTWSNVVYKLSVGNCSQACVNGFCLKDDVCHCDSGWNGTTCDTHVCQHGCVNGECIGPNTCMCYPGWNDTSTDCSLDINECDNSSICHHYCNNTQGSYHCYCQDGYTLLHDNYTCEDIPIQSSNFLSTSYQRLTTITMTGLIATPVVSSTESTNSTDTVIISTSVGVLVILLVGVVILVVGSSLCLMRYRKKQLPLQEEVTTDADILAQNNISYIPTGSQRMNLEDNPSYSSTTAAADPNVDGVYIDVNTSYNAVHHANSNEEDDYI